MARYRKPGTRPKKPVNPVDREDTFVAATLEATNWARKHQTVLTLGVVLVVLGVGALVYYGRFRDTLSLQAAAQLEELQLRMDAGDNVGVRSDLQLFIERFAGTPSEGEARIALAQVAAGLDEPEIAVEALAPLARDIGNPLGAQAAAMLAAVYEDAGNRDDARQLYLRLADRAQLGFQVREALAAAARLARESGDPAAALALYDRLLDEMEDDEIGRGEIEMRRAEVAAVVGASGAGGL